MTVGTIIFAMAGIVFTVPKLLLKTFEFDLYAEEVIEDSEISEYSQIKTLATSLLLKEEKDNGCVPYKDNKGYPTICIGKLCAHIKVNTLEEVKIACSSLLSICTPEKCREWFDQDIEQSYSCMNRYKIIKDAFDKASILRKTVLISMAYQCGCEGLSKFKKTLTYMANEEWDKASDEMLDSDWYRKDSSNRAKRHADIMKNDKNSKYCSYYGWSN